MSDHAAVLFINQAFYHAFATRDVAAMELVWSEKAAISCIHPGWLALSGREAVMRSWAGILSNPESPKITCRQPMAYVHGDTAYVICYELVEGSFLAATNVFVREAPTWRMVHHQAGVSPRPPVEEVDLPPPTLQ
ncbi:MAG: DUF4440 domain-containing protein [Rhodospirillales bacterium]|nr:MAG: DUF4440 domain-containing protein [Rhodospirillales bacterium]